MAGRRIGRTVVGFVVAVVALAVAVLVVSVLAVGLAVAVLVPTVAVVGGGIGLVVGVLVMAVGRGLAGGRSPGRGIGGYAAVVTGIAVLGLEAVVGLLDGEAVPRLGVGRQGEGDVTTKVCETDAEFVDELRELARWNDEAGYGPIKIDAVFHDELRQAFENLGLADLLH